jgi:MIP family channel proteins
LKLKALIAEFIGTFCLLFAGVGSAIACDKELSGVGPTSLLLVSLAHGLAIAICVSAMGHISGGHFNPAVSLGLAIGKKLDVVSLIGYWIAQLAGAIAGTVLVQFAFPSDIVVSHTSGTPALHLLTQSSQGMILEAVAVFFLVLVVFGTAVDKRGSKTMAPWIIGMTITAMMLTLGATTGGSINPARWFGPSMITSMFVNPEVYFLGPLIGGALAALVYTQVLAKGDMDAEAA